MVVVVLDISNPSRPTFRFDCSKRFYVSQVDPSGAKWSKVGPRGVKLRKDKNKDKDNDKKEEKKTKTKKEEKRQKQKEKIISNFKYVKNFKIF